MSRLTNVLRGARRHASKKASDAFVEPPQLFDERAPFREDVFLDDDDNDDYLFRSTTHEVSTPFDPNQPAPSWMRQYTAPRQRLQSTTPAPLIATETLPPPSFSEEDETAILTEAHALSRRTASNPLWGESLETLTSQYGKGAALRLHAEGRELKRQTQAFDTIEKQRKEWGLHPIHFVKRFDTRLDEWGEDRVPYSQEKLESEKAKYLIEDHQKRKELEEEYAQQGWGKHQVWKLINDWYKHLPEPTRFFQTHYYKSMRPRKSTKKQRNQLKNMKEENGLVVFEERNAHRVIRAAMTSGELPHVHLPPPRLIWERLPQDSFIDDNILSRNDVTLERRQGAILLRRWLPNGQKISCEVLGADYLNDIRHPTPLDVDWPRIEASGGFLIHITMCNSIDHINNFKIVLTLEEAVQTLCAHHVDPSVEFKPNDYLFFPYLWVTNEKEYMEYEGDWKE